MQPFGSVESLFKRRHFDGQILVLCVSCYASFRRSLRDLVIMMADRGITLTHTTILRWSSITCQNARSVWNRYARPVGDPGGWTRPR
jgi:transposase-like protein